MLWAAIFQAIAKGITNLYSTWNYLKETKQQAKEMQGQAQEQADARAKKAKYDMQQQKTSFLKGGVYFDSGTPTQVINETYNTAMQDINAINQDTLTAQKKLKRAGRTAFITHIIDPVGNDSSAIANNIYEHYQTKNNFNNTNTNTTTNKSVKTKVKATAANSNLWSGSTASGNTFA